MTTTKKKRRKKSVKKLKYSNKKLNFVHIATLAGIILILLVLLVALFQQVYVFVSSVYTEITYRVRV
jgi:hypothetical protein